MSRVYSAVYSSQLDLRKCNPSRAANRHDNLAEFVDNAQLAQLAQLTKSAKNTEAK